MRKFNSAAFLIAAVVMACAHTTWAAPGHRVAGSGLGGASPYATDAYPGFDGLDEIPTPEKRTRSWFLSVSRDTPEEQFLYAKQQEAAGNIRAARRACDALVREWPASPEAPLAQLEMARILENEDKDYDEAFEAFDYLLDFYPRECDFSDVVDHQFELVNKMRREPRSFLGFRLDSNRVMRQHYEKVVRRAPGAPYAAEAMLKIAQLREDDQQYEDAVEVYGALMNKYPASEEAVKAAYFNGKARMWLARRLAYNIPRCKDTVQFLEMALKQRPNHPNAEEMRTWLKELKSYMAEDAYQRAKFYDSNQRTKHAAITAWENFLVENPESSHTEDVKKRIVELKEMSNEK